ncbi:MAG: lysine biosynthesis protein LysX [Phycisphaerales bacterium JB043]
MRIAMTHTRLRAEERLLLDAFENLGAVVELIDLRRVVFDPTDVADWARFDAVVDRSVSLTASLVAVRVLEGLGIRCINPARVIETCSDKLATSIALAGAGIAQPSVRVATSEEAGVEAVEQIGYPAVLKPTVGSWGRLVARLNDRDATEAVLEHRRTLGSAQQGVFYVQQHINKPDRDIRVFVVAGEPVAAIMRHSEHWVTNTARGAQVEGLEISSEMGALCRAAATAVGADAVAVDVLECPDRGLLVNELNHSMEFRNSIGATGVNIPRLIAQHVLQIAEQTRQAVGVGR